MLGSLIGAAGTLASGLLGQSAQNKQSKTQERIWSEQRADQLDSLQQGIRWRVNDAQKAGIHPLYALGASIPTYSPQSMSFGGSQAMANSVGTASRMIGSGLNDYMRRGADLDLKLKQAQIDQINAQTRVLTQPGAGNTPMESGYGNLPGQRGPKGQRPSKGGYRFDRYQNRDGVTVIELHPNTPIGVDENIRSWYAQNTANVKLPPPPQGMKWYKTGPGRWQAVDRVTHRPNIIQRWWNSFDGRPPSRRPRPSIRPGSGPSVMQRRRNRMKEIWR